MPNSYVQWITANDALAKCMSGQNVDAFKAMSAADQNLVCKTEADAVKEILTSNKINFRSLLAERQAALKQ